MKLNDAFPSNFLKEADLEDEEMVVTIKTATLEKIGDDEKIVCSFKETDKQLVVNKTNFTSIVKATGEDDTDDWPGHRVVLYPTETNFKGEMVACIRVKSKPPKAKAAAAKAAAKHPADEDDDFLDEDGTAKF